MERGGCLLLLPSPEPAAVPGALAPAVADLAGSPRELRNLIRVATFFLRRNKSSIKLEKLPTAVSFPAELGHPGKGRGGFQPGPGITAVLAITGRQSQEPCDPAATVKHCTHKFPQRHIMSLGRGRKQGGARLMTL